MEIHSERKKRLSLSLLFKIIKDTVWGFIDDSVMRLSASLAYATLFSIIPFLSLLVTVGVFFHMDLANQLYVQLQPIVGPEVTEALRSIIEKCRKYRLLQVGRLCQLRYLYFWCHHYFCRNTKFIKFNLGNKSRP